MGPGRSPGRDFLRLSDVTFDTFFQKRVTFLEELCQTLAKGVKLWKEEEDRIVKLSITEAATLLGKSHRQIRYLIRTGRLPAAKVGSRWRIESATLPLSDAERQELAQRSELARKAFEHALQPAIKAARPEAGEAADRQPGVAEFLGLDPGFPPPGCGLPIGNLTSQWWGNQYLSGPDHFIKRDLRIPHYQRYMDDLTLVADSRSQLVEAREAVAEWLWAERRLRLKVPDRAPRSAQGHFDYLGYRVSRAGIRPRRELLRRMQARVSELVLRGPTEKVERSAASYRGVVGFGQPG